MRFKRENQHWVCNIVEYFYKEKESNLSISRNIESYQHFISSFTGKLFVTEPLTKQVSSFDYVQGKRQTTQARSSAATSCLQYSCTWYLSCPPGFYIGEAIVVGTGGDSCEEPTGYTLSCGYDTRYQLTHSSVTNTCGGYGGPGDPGDPGDTGGGGDGTDDGGPFDPGIFTTEPATADPDLPSDCGSWQFQRVGPSGYMACGVTGIEIDLLSQFQNADGSPNVSLNVYRANLFFEMPARYTPGEAATICAQIKDEVEEFLEDLYRNQSPPQIAQSINSTFIREMRSRVASVGGRVTQTAQYPNTPVGPYGHTFLPNNGGCM